MNMLARSLSLFQSPLRTSSSSSSATLFAAKSSPPSPHVFRLLPHRTQSTQPDNNSSSSSSDSSPDSDALAVQGIEDAIHRIIVKRSAPDWLPFYPGASYWVPPRKPSYGVADLIQKLTNSLTEEEVMSLTTSRGWPSSAFFVNGAPVHREEEDTSSDSIAQPVDEEG